MHAPVRDHDHAGKPVRRHIGERRAERSEQTGPVSLAIGLPRLDHPHFESGNTMQLIDDLGARRVGLLCAVAEILAWALVDHDDSDRTQRIAVLAREGRIGERQRDQGQCEGSHGGAAATRHEKEQRE